MKSSKSFILLACLATTLDLRADQTLAGNVTITNGANTGRAALEVVSDSPSVLPNIRLMSGQDRTPRIHFNGPWSIANPTLSYAVIMALNDNGGPGSPATASLRFHTASGDPGVLSEKMVIMGNGNVGIGTASPITALHVIKRDNADNLGIAFFEAYSGSTNMTPSITFRTARGAVEAPSPTLAGDALAGVSSQGYTTAGAFGVRSASIRFWATENYTGTPQGSYMTLETTPIGTSTRQVALTISSNGNTGIGTISPTHKLSVNGTVRAKEVIVETTGWSDYVLAPDYKLPTLAETEQHIIEHGHLPGIPSSSEVVEQGISVGEIQTKLLAKIEELTLHQIAMEKEIRRLRSEISESKGKIE